MQVAVTLAETKILAEKNASEYFMAVLDLTSRCHDEEIVNYILPKKYHRLSLPRTSMMTSRTHPLEPIVDYVLKESNQDVDMSSERFTALQESSG